MMTEMANTLTCIVCRSALAPGHQDWHFTCRRCGLERSNLKVKINHNFSLDEDQRLQALHAVRQRNAKQVIGHLTRLLNKSSLQILDVGPGPGWFLDEAAKIYAPVGIEPDRSIFDRLQSKGHKVINGFFPEDVPKDQMFDAIIFNDVLEHIEDIPTAISKCSEMIFPGGLLSVALPVKSGLFYKLSKIMSMAGFPSFFKRLWQVDMPSPHLYYFSTKNLTQLVETDGFRLAVCEPMDVLTYDGLFERIRYSGENSFLKATVLFLPIAFLVFLHKLLPRDTFLLIFTKAK